MHELLLAYMAVFRQASLEPGPSGPEIGALSARPPRPSNSSNFHTFIFLRELLKNIKANAKTCIRYT